MKTKINELVKKSIEEMNMQMEEDKKISTSEDSILFGSGAVMDSMDFVTLICIIEDNIYSEFGKSITIVSEKAFSKKYNPFKDLRRLCEFITELLEGELS